MSSRQEIHDKTQAAIEAINEAAFTVRATDVVLPGGGAHRQLAELTDDLNSAVQTYGLSVQRLLAVSGGQVAEAGGPPGSALAGPDGRAIGA